MNFTEPAISDREDRQDVPTVASGSGRVRRHANSGTAGIWTWPDVILVASLVVIGFVLRSIGVGWESIWYDEACSLKMASASFHDLITGAALDIGNPCGYFILLKLWCSVFGYTIESARIFSAVADVMSIVITWVFAMTICRDRRIAVTAVVMVTINPAMIFLAREARVFGLLTALVTTVAWLTEKILRDGRRRYWVALTACSIVLPHLHYYTLFVLTVLWIPLVFGRKDERLSRFVQYVGMGLISLLCFLPWSPNFLLQLTLWTAPFNPWMKHAAYFPVYTLAGRTGIWKQDGLMMMLLAQVVVLGGVYLPALLSIKSVFRIIRVPALIAIGVMSLALFVSVVYDSLLNCRYLSPVIPCIIIAWSVAIWHLPQRLKMLRWCSIALVCLIAMGSLGRMYARNHKHDWRGVAAMISHRAADSPVVFYEDIGEESFHYYRAGHATRRVPERFGNAGEGWNESGLESELQQMGDFWFCLWTLDDWEAIETWMEDRFDRIDAADFGEIQVRRYQVKPTTVP
ncbi:hypothetical protein K227x_17820 [Rubripirellula lacrimiformis]|uniref:Glycosyltransferase RgtA/B/C/D-like domain-containing protein n=1 Tax=Rubripirellula lacrimiformis TaxID=1930273 RepID=A0A517N8E6_9BACT|nr:glycosyltransferase family 39 protein [Rubripirellula lacrimiformis]QDT03400.1 hypothetical protein K227x_17820 [Rubripirellula lacrimiformis]